MGNIKRFFATTICGILLMSGCAGASQRKEQSASYPMPEIKKDCASCHLAAGPNNAGKLKKNLSMLCLDCHPDRRAPAEHKIDIIPSLEVKGLPLTDGKMTCFTCHDPHQNAYGSLLRMKPRNLCLVCHAL